MKTIFDPATREELIGRINSLNANSPRQWGKMSVGQMIKHCALWEEMALGKRKYKRKFVGRLFGGIALKQVLKDDSPLRRGTPTLPEFRIVEQGDVEVEKARWISLIRDYEHYNEQSFVHPFFGKMTTEQLGQMDYKHIDHHLRQFGA